MKNGMSRKDVEAVFAAKNSFATVFFAVRWRATGTRNPCRTAFAFSASCGTAVRRNLFKRRLRALVRDLPACRGLDLVFVARRPLKGITEEIWPREASKVIRGCETLGQHAGRAPSASL